MRTRTKKGMLMLLTATIITGSLIAQPRQGRGPGMGMGPASGDNFQPRFGLSCIVADLTEDQKNELEKIRTAHFQEMQDHRNQMAELAAKQRTIMSKYEVDTDAAKKIANQKSEMMKKRMEINIDHQAEVKKVLTEEQYLQLQQMRQRRQFAKGNRGGHWNRGNNGRGNFGPGPGCNYGVGGNFNRGGFGPGRNINRGGFGPGAMNENGNINRAENYYGATAWMKQPFI